ncbi:MULTISPECIES: MFS transporter [Duncaniella]|uniref:MFS transporter n=1 Tax=Duncaniella dubosii TaxID=2518971 RepID=A0A4P7W2T9_9BACT|nr:MULTISPECIES: MFS transporter [Duncaniella]MBJ2190289.1 MFS transporter [Muribaculaceae bacterium]MCX4283733.1 MFS transporter [Duncaniella dubosii]QCD42296.1 MFS transporter [Duncaniella dubosii]
MKADSKTVASARNPWAWIPTLYFAQGLPYVAVMTISVIMYKRLGLSNTDIALYTGWLYLPWVIKPFWSPFVDIISTKRHWTITMQWLIGIAFAGIAFALPTSFFFSLTLAIFWLVGFTSATHDIAADGYYMLALTEHQQSLYVGIRSTFYRIATVAGQGLLVILAGAIEDSSGDIPFAWSVVFGILSVMFLSFALYHSRILPKVEQTSSRQLAIANDVWREFITVFAEFFRKKQVGVAIVFMLLYRLPEAQLVKLINPFLLDPPSAGGLGLSTGQVGIVYGTVGIIGLTLGGIIGGITAARRGLKFWLRPMAWSMSLTCLTFVYLSFADEPSLTVVNVCVFIEQFGYGFGFTAYMLYLIYFSEGRHRTAHYSICTGFMALGMMLPGMAAGWIQETIGYQNFFIWTMICCIATIGVTYLIKINPEFGKKV